MKIDEVEYKLTTRYKDDLFSTINELRNGEAIRWYEAIAYRTPDGKARMCYADDTSNNWEV